MLAWTWFGAADATSIAPQVVSGRGSDYGRSLSIERNWLMRLGLAFRALEGQRLEPFKVSGSSLYGRWRRAAREHGIRSALAVPLASLYGDERGIFVVYADVPQYFERVGVGLFESLAHLFSAVLSEGQRRRTLDEAARVDPLTGLGNRRSADGLAALVQR